MIAEAVGKIQAIEQQLTEKTKFQLQARLTIRACLKELREIRGPANHNTRIGSEEHAVSFVGSAAS
jgi:hypothetical protein